MPILPQICHRLSIAIAGVNIGDPVIVQAGVHILHGKVVIDGVTEIRTGRRDRALRLDRADLGEHPRPDDRGGRDGGRQRSVLGKLTVGKGATIGANAAVFRDVPAGARVVPAAGTVVGPRDQTRSG